MRRLSSARRMAASLRASSARRSTASCRATSALAALASAENCGIDWHPVAMNDRARMVAGSKCFIVVSRLVDVLHDT